MAGALEGDYYKGLLHKNSDLPLLAGIRLHRSIDAFTDAHPLVAALRCEFSPELRRYSGILIDLGFDHYLSKHWALFSELPLAEFNNAVHRKLSLQRDALSSDASHMFDRLVEYDILNLYMQWETVPATARRIGQRFKRHNPFQDIDAELTKIRDPMEDAFLDFYPELVSFSHNHQQLHYPSHTTSYPTSRGP